MLLHQSSSNVLSRRNQSRDLGLRSGAREEREGGEGTAGKRMYESSKLIMVLDQGAVVNRKMMVFRDLVSFTGS